jgi:type III secretion protein C
MIFIRPVIIDTEEDIEDVTKRQQDVFRQKSKQRRRWNFEVNEALSHMNVKSTDPDERTDCNPDCCTVPQ